MQGNIINAYQNLIGQKTSKRNLKKRGRTSPSDVTDRSDRKGLKWLRWFIGLQSPCTAVLVTKFNSRLCMFEHASDMKTQKRERKSDVVTPERTCVLRWSVVTHYMATWPQSTDQRNLIINIISDNLNCLSPGHNKRLLIENNSSMQHHMQETFIRGLASI